MAKRSPASLPRQTLDPDNKGYIEAEKLRNLLTTHGERFSQARGAARAALLPCRHRKGSLLRSRLLSLNASRRRLTISSALRPTPSRG